MNERRYQPLNGLRLNLIDANFEFHLISGHSILNICRKSVLKLICNYVLERLKWYLENANVATYYTNISKHDISKLYCYI
jgi:hypothetical protein